MSPLASKLETRPRRRESGMAIVLVMLVVAVLSLLSIAGTRSAQTELQMGRSHRLGRQALSVAEAGINHAYSLIKGAPIAQFNAELSNGGTGGLLATLGTSATLSGQTYRFGRLGSGTADGYYVQAVDNHDETSGVNDAQTDQDMRIYLVSRGRVGGAERIVRAMVSRTPAFPVGLFGETSVTLSGSGTTDSYDSRLGPYSAAMAGSEGHVRSNGDVNATGTDTVINGDAISSGTTNIGNSAVVTGAELSGAPPLYFPPVEDCGPPYSSGAGISGDDWNYDPNTGVLETVSHSTIVLAGGTYCFSSLIMNSHSILRVESPVQIYLTAPSNLSGGSIVNVSHKAADLQVYSSLVSDPKDKKSFMSLSGGTDTYMAVYAPRAWIKFSGNSAFTGAVVGDIITNSGGAQLHYDVALRDISSGGVRLTNWHEVRN